MDCAAFGRRGFETVCRKMKQLPNIKDGANGKKDKENRNNE
jgi:hypothetical protein